ncbi:MULTISPECIES: hypothetical protein [unclassified Oceanobacillus]|uniref:hypothetical protein n=1 Tax=unclassified Oceanobacillus TaxID=2630292 RepID=UPI001BE8769D|nr:MULTISPECIES: hypothetical protein [unclassified Oceanobacillus]MBT2600937.1 hypothetical protein [Oceanobacillus sp. ISL-74]MBT2653612.1 hypothetical protein [Oceanobacillus sp. ISL-73]
MTFDDYILWQEVLERIGNASYEYGYLKEHLEKPELEDLNNALILLDKVYETGYEKIKEYEKTNNL